MVSGDGLTSYNLVNGDRKDAELLNKYLQADTRDSRPTRTKFFVTEELLGISEC